MLIPINTLFFRFCLFVHLTSPNYIKSWTYLFKPHVVVQWNRNIAKRVATFFLRWCKYILTWDDAIHWWRWAIHSMWISSLLQFSSSLLSEHIHLSWMNCLPFFLIIRICSCVENNSSCIVPHFQSHSRNLFWGGIYHCHCPTRQD